MNLKKCEEGPKGLRVMMSIRPEWTEKIFAREKVIEVRRTAPHIENERQFPIKVYVYETKGTKAKPGAGAVISFIIFIASTMASVWPVSTSWPTFTNGSSSGEGET